MIKAKKLEIFKLGIDFQITLNYIMYIADREKHSLFAQGGDEPPNKIGV